MGDIIVIEGAQGKVPQSPFNSRPQTPLKPEQAYPSNWRPKLWRYGDEVRQPKLPNEMGRTPPAAPFLEMPLYDVYVKVTTTNLPPRWVHLSDNIVAQLVKLLLKKQVTAKALNYGWPHIFDTKGLIVMPRPPMGSAGIVRYEGKIFYTSAMGYVFAGGRWMERLRQSEDFRYTPEECMRKHPWAQSNSNCSRITALYIDSAVTPVPEDGYVSTILDFDRIRLEDLAEYKFREEEKKLIQQWRTGGIEINGKTYSATNPAPTAPRTVLQFMKGSVAPNTTPPSQKRTEIIIDDSRSDATEESQATAGTAWMPVNAPKSQPATPVSALKSQTAVLGSAIRPQIPNTETPTVTKPQTPAIETSAAPVDAAVQTTIPVRNDELSLAPLQVIAVVPTPEEEIAINYNIGIINDAQVLVSQLERNVWHSYDEQTGQLTAVQQKMHALRQNAIQSVRRATHKRKLSWDDQVRISNPKIYDVDKSKIVGETAVEHQAGRSGASTELSKLAEESPVKGNSRIVGETAVEHQAERSGASTELSKVAEETPVKGNNTLTELYKELLNEDSEEDHERALF